MNDLIHKATAGIARLLSAKLPDLSPDWWQKLVQGGSKLYPVSFDGLGFTE